MPRNASRTEEKECVQFFGDMSRFPDCLKRIQWMRAGWTTHRCYADYGVDGSFCSIRRYLSEVEKHCPRVAEETNVEPTVDNYAELLFSHQFPFQERTDLSLLLSILQGKAEDFDYIKNRLSYHWSRWVEAFHIAKSKYPNSMSHRRKMNILIHLGLLSEPSVGIGAKARSGGPLGELLQWSDLIASLFLLGHNLFISTDKATLMSQIDEFATNEPCPTSGKYIDLIITDIIGLRSFKRRKDFLLRNKCRIRLVDSFGTHVEYNYKSYFNAHQKDLKGLVSSVQSRKPVAGGGNPWGGHGLQLLQHWTFFPHTPDNDFLGFAVHQSNVKPLFERKSRSRPACLIYGKEKYMWEKSEAVVAVLKNLMEVHATVADVNATDHPLFSGIINHGFLNVTQIEALLKSVDIFVGLGFPYEGIL
ncbi:unnamed protein product [Nippostrongylus brasiliensis]|uniref:alpha-1,6-mannosyl-glycoprotein 6-beta-N-acetylglucosaminyltransferase n=1 Tax=Nippostrongylus brasiliensis TaxID=27835 RepID=A0A0N4XGW7_NIPBR|nr:unnamed protein product [Nippostrongylus brasiliensis]